MNTENDKVNIDVKNGKVYLTQGDRVIILRLRQWEELRGMLSNAFSWARTWLKQFEPDSAELEPKRSHCGCAGDESEG